MALRSLGFGLSVHFYIILPATLVGYCWWNNRSGPYNSPDNQPCDLVSQR